MGWLRDRRVLALLVAAYVVALGVLVVAPWGWALNRFTVWLYVTFRSDWPLAPDWARPEHYGFLLNVLLFVPLGALVALATRWAWWWVTMAAVLASGAIELVQWAWLVREASVQDVVANTLGAFVGSVAVSLARRARRPPAGR